LIIAIVESILAYASMAVDQPAFLTVGPVNIGAHEHKDRLDIASVERVVQASELVMGHAAFACADSLKRRLSLRKNASTLHREEVSNVASTNAPAVRTNTAKGNCEASPSDTVMASPRQHNKAADAKVTFRTLNPSIIAAPRAPSMMLSIAAKLGIRAAGRNEFTCAV
jgi:hypothetical protein